MTGTLEPIETMEDQPAPRLSLACTDCGNDDPQLRYRSGKMPRCYDCQNYFNLSMKRTGGGVLFSRPEFVAWKRATPERRFCVYCGIDGPTLYSLGVVNVRNGRVYESIGVDRLDNTLPYSLDDIVPCCGVCNAIKGGILTFAEMKRLGSVLGELWSRRLATAPS